MAFFQNSVLNRYIETQNEEIIQAAYEQYTCYFHDPAIQQNIRNSKEEQFQEGFLRELFVHILGYTLNPIPNYNLTTELKNEKGAQKADGAILKDGKALAVIELKGTDTTDLDKINAQAFNYKNNHSNCVYVITSNFEKLRFFIHNSVAHLEFSLFHLTKDRFRLLWLCLHADNLLKGLPLKIKEESLLVDEKITHQLYKDYASFRTDLWHNMVKNNPSMDRLLLFKKTQKLIDRFLFIFFAEDSGLLPPNSILRILQRWDVLKEEDAYKPLYDIFKQYFGYINKGRSGKSPSDDIFAYNGGLFLPDEVLDEVLIDDDILDRHVNVLTRYNFQSEVDVNILGQIFENSLNEIESITAELEGKEIDRGKTKRKKDGVFYTPKYITKYIVDQTVGKLCEEKKAELGIVDEEFAKGKKNRKKETVKKLEEQLKAYRNWLLGITICDPACGSGAFLNQALEFLMEEHAYIDELQTKLFGLSIIFQDVSNHILENNLYGVDINEESVEIAKLSLWLRTARRGRKLSSLNHNIQCGNSLIDDPGVAGEKAFNWQERFPDVFAKGGFDVVIGNPPYVDIKGLDNKVVKELFKKFHTTENRINLYSIFVERGFCIVKTDGYLSFIIPNSILVNSSYRKIRNLLINHLTSIVKLPDGVFKEAIVETIILELKKDSKEKYVKTIVFPKRERISVIDESRVQYAKKDDWRSDSANYNIYVNLEQSELLKKIRKDAIELNEIADFSLGISPYDKHKGHSPELITSRGYHSMEKLDDTYKPLITGENIVRYVVKNEVKEYLKYGEWLGRPREERFFKEPRILVRQIISGNPPRIFAGFTNESLYFTHIGFGIIPKDQNIKVKPLLGILNSKLMNFYHMYSFLDLEKELFQKILIANCKRFPIKESLLETDLSALEDKVNWIIRLSNELEEVGNKFRNFLLSAQKVELSKRIDNWKDMDFGKFLSVLNKSIINSGGKKLSKLEEMDWMEIFEKKILEVQALNFKIEQTDREIDQLVYGLYGLQAEEIAIIEESVKN